MTSTVMISTVVERARREQAAIEAVYPTDKTELAESWSRTFVIEQIAFDIGASIARSGGGVEDHSGYQQASASVMRCQHETNCNAARAYL